MRARHKLIKWFPAVVLSVLSCAAAALDYRSVAVSGAVMFAEPALQSKKLYLFSRDTPLELVSTHNRWVKVRDISGAMGWMESTNLSTRRTVQVTAARVEVKSRADDAASGLYAVERDVTLELLEPPTGSWAKVKHRDGKPGYISIKNIWGL